jgi:hypothetical protein
VVRRPAELVPPTAADAERLAAAVARPDEDQLQRPAGPIRMALLRAVRPDGLTKYRLWQLAREHRPELGKSQVYEYLRGERELSAPALEALLLAAHLEVKPRARQPRTD